MFLTLLTKEPEKNRAFYERLSHVFNAEQHGKGPLHFSTIVNDMPVEIYPQLKSLPAEDKLFIGVDVEAPETVKADLIQNFGGSETTPPTPVTASGIATLRDPSGVLVRLFPKK